MWSYKDFVSPDEERNSKKPSPSTLPLKIKENDQPQPNTTPTSVFERNGVGKPQKKAERSAAAQPPTVQAICNLNTPTTETVLERPNKI